MCRIQVLMLLVFIEITSISAYNILQSINTSGDRTRGLIHNSTTNQTGWNWKQKINSFNIGNSVGEQKSDWIWNQNVAIDVASTPSSVSGRTVNFQVIEDTSHGNALDPQWPHQASEYDPHEFQRYPQSSTNFAIGQLHQNLNLNDNRSPTHLTNQAEYVWKTLRPGLPQKHHHIEVKVPLLPGSGDQRNDATAVESNSSIGPLSLSQNNQFPFPEDTNRKHGHENAGKNYYNSQYLYPAYGRQRYRFEIHPGIIAAPIAGLAAYGVAHALSVKPLLFEVGLVDKKSFPNQNIHHQNGIQPILGQSQATSQTQFPLPPGNHHHQPITTGHSHHPPINTGHIHHLPHAKPQFPTTPHHPLEIPRGQQYEDYQSIQSIDKTTSGDNKGRPWWSPIAAMIPRLRRMTYLERD